MNPSAKSVSVVIRNRNEAAYLGHVLKALAQQSHRPDEIIVVDNESTDGSLEVARQAGATIVTIGRQDFSYGGSLNLGIGKASGEIIILLSAHSYPLGVFFLDEALAPFVDVSVAAAAFRNMVNVSLYGNWTEPKTFRGKVAWKELWLYGPSNWGCAIRRKVWEKVPFDDKIESAEDKGWVRDILGQGYSITTSTAFIWYMRKRSFWEGLRAFQRDQVASMRMSGETGEHVGVSEVCHVWARQPVLALRAMLEILFRWAIVRTASRLAKKPPRAGSVR